jgi:hypothetical protein
MTRAEKARLAFAATSIDHGRRRLALRPAGTLPEAEGFA